MGAARPARPVRERRGRRARLGAAPLKPMPDSQTLIEPYGGRLVDLLAAPGELRELTEYAKRLPSIQLSERSTCDLELLATGAFSPLGRFMSAADHERVLAEMRLASGHVFPVPVALPVEPGAL